MIDNNLRYILIKAMCDQNSKLAQDISLNPTYTNEFKKTRIYENNDGTQQVIDKLIQETTNHE